MGVARSEFVPILVDFLQQRKSAPKQGVSQLEAAELLKQRFQEREADAQNTFEDFALNGEIRIGDLPDLIPEFATVLGLELAGANPDSLERNLLEFFSLNASPSGGDSVAQYITYDPFVNLLAKFVASTGELLVTDQEAEADAAPAQSEGGAEDAAAFRMNLVNSIRNFEKVDAGSAEEKERIDSFL